MSKAEAVDQTLVEAGIDGEWFAAKHAKQYHMLTTGNRKNQERKGYAFGPISAEIADPLFFVTPIEERDTRPTGQTFAFLDHLGLSYPCAAAEEKAAHRRLAKLAHPDQGGSEDDFLSLTAAYELALRICRE